VTGPYFFREIKIPLALSLAECFYLLAAPLAIVEVNYLKWRKRKTRRG